MDKPTHRFELRLDQHEALALRQMAEEEGSSAADFVRKLIRVAARRADAERQFHARQRLADDALEVIGVMSRMLGVVTSAVFTAPAGTKVDPEPEPSGHPMPIYHHVADLAHGVIVAEGFPTLLGEGERSRVEQRFPSYAVTWRLTGLFDEVALDEWRSSATGSEAALLDAALRTFDVERHVFSVLEPHFLVQRAPGGVHPVSTARLVLQRMASVGAARERKRDVFESTPAVLEYLDKRAKA